MNILQPEKEYCIISVIGSHAGESSEEIFERKILDTHKVGKTFWMIKSFRAKPDMIQEILKKAQNNNSEVKVYFIEASSKGGAIPTKTSELSKCYSQNKIEWESFPTNLSQVTGKIDAGACAVVLDKLELIEEVIDLWDYADFFSQEEKIKIQQGASTVCAIRKDMSNCNNPIKSHIRKTIAVGTLCFPGGVWLK
jgi:hypothetical protein